VISKDIDYFIGGGGAVLEYRRLSANTQGGGVKSPAEIWRRHTPLVYPIAEEEEGAGLSSDTPDSESDFS